jgi:hypothetical protein
MKNSDMPAMPTYEINTDCGFDGNSGPDLVQTINTGLTKREHFAGLAMAALLANSKWFDGARSEFGSDAVCGVVSRSAIVIADALLAELDKEVK